MNSLLPPNRRLSPTRSSRRTLVFAADLDGMLFDAPAHTLAEAGGAFRVLEEKGIPLVVCSRRTRVEVQALQQRLGLMGPFISERGGALYVPSGYFPHWPIEAHRKAPYDVIEFGPPHDVIARTLQTVSRRVDVDVVAFSEMSIEEVAAACDLTLPEARLAKFQEYSETFQFVHEDPAEERQLRAALNRSGFQCFRRGPLHHVTGVSDSSRSVQLLRSLYEHTERVLTFGLTNRAEDTWVLREVDIPISLCANVTRSPRWANIVAVVLGAPA
jgi:mannosyl-3-phosphoglycerate phosphatase